MNTIKVKICGIQSLASANNAINAGADFLGFNFVKTSKRYIHPSLVLYIAQRVKGKIKLVGVFQNAPILKVNDIARRLHLDYVQLHGEEDNEYCRKIKSLVI